MLTKQEILTRTNLGLAVFRHFVPGEWQVGKRFKNPFYEDTRPSCTIYFDKHQQCYRINDFGDSRYRGDCFALVALLHGLDCSDAGQFAQVLGIIAEQLGLASAAPASSSETKPVPVRKTRSGKPQPAASMAPAAVSQPSESVASSYLLNPVLSPTEQTYWQSYGIGEAVRERYGVVSLHSFTLRKAEGKAYTVTSSEAEPVFGYVLARCIKVYRPFSRHRFLYLGQKPADYVFGLEQLPARGDVLFITGGEKDVLSLSAHGFCALCFNSETASIPPAIIQKLSYRFKHLVLLYDTDVAGVDASTRHLQQLKDYDLKRLILPLPGTKDAKDVSDFFRRGGTAAQLKSLLIGLLAKLYEHTFALLKPCEIDFAHPPPIPEPLICINDVTIGSAGNLLGITGGEGTGKSNFLGGLIAGTLPAGSETIDSLGTQVKANSDQKALLYYDTEQSEDQLYRNLQSVLRRAGQSKPPGWFRAYCLTHLSRQERLRVIVQSMDRFHHQYGGIHLVVIDGIGDLIRSLNDEAESIALIEELHRLAGIYQTCILCVLHLVPSGIKLRGHLGSELQRKAAGILCIEKDSETDVSSVKALKVRSGSPLDVPLLEFAWDKDKGYHVYRGEKSKEAKQSRKQADLVELARELFDGQESYTYTALAAAIENSLEVSLRTAKSYIRFMLDNGIIAKHTANGLFTLHQSQIV